MKATFKVELVRCEGPATPHIRVLTEAIQKWMEYQAINDPNAEVYNIQIKMHNMTSATIELNDDDF